MHRHKQKTHQQRHQYGQGHIARAADDARGDGPEHEGRVRGLLDGRAETDDGQCAHHTQRQHHIGGDHQDHHRRDHGEHDQALGEALAVAHAAVGHAVYIHDEHTQRKGQSDGHQGIGDGDGRKFLQKPVLNNIRKIRHSFSLSQMVFRHSTYLETAMFTLGMSASASAR